jgi:hypothetical protein
MVSYFRRKEERKASVAAAVVVNSATYRPREWARPFDRDRREWAWPAFADHRRPHSTMADAWPATVVVAVDSGLAFVGSGVVVVGARPPPAAAAVAAVAP